MSKEAVRQRSHVQTGDGTVFVTVGTTKFDKLIEAAADLQAVQKLKDLGYRRLLMQIGAGSFEPDLSLYKGVAGFSVEYFRYKSSIKEDIEAASLVLSHAGAGSVLETLGAKKPLVVVINEDLMGNHQLELAYQLSEDGHLYYCTPKTLLETLSTVNFKKLTPFPPGKPELFADYLDKLMGY